MVVKVEQSQRNSSIFSGQNSSQFQFIPSQARNPVSSQNHHSSQSHVQIVNQAQAKKEELKTKMPSFEFNTVLKDVKSRLNSSKSVESVKSTSTPSSCIGNNTALMTGASGASIPTVDLSLMRGSIFSRGRSEETSNSIFSPNFRQSSEHNNVVLTRDVRISMADVQSSNKSTPISSSGASGNEPTMTTQKRPRHMEVAKPDAKRVSPYN